MIKRTIALAVVALLTLAAVHPNTAHAGWFSDAWDSVRSFVAHQSEFWSANPMGPETTRRARELKQRQDREMNMNSAERQRGREGERGG